MSGFDSITGTLEDVGNSVSGLLDGMKENEKSPAISKALENVKNGVGDFSTFEEAFYKEFPEAARDESTKQTLEKIFNGVKAEVANNSLEAGELENFADQVISLAPKKPGLKGMLREWGKNDFFRSFIESLKKDLAENKLGWIGKALAMYVISAVESPEPESPEQSDEAQNLPPEQPAAPDETSGETEASEASPQPEELSEDQKQMIAKYKESLKTYLDDNSLTVAQLTDTKFVKGITSLSKIVHDANAALGPEAASIMEKVDSEVVLEHLNQASNSQNINVLSISQSGEIRVRRGGEEISLIIEAETKSDGTKVNVIHRAGKDDKVEWDGSPKGLGGAIENLMKNEEAKSQQAATDSETPTE